MKIENLVRYLIKDVRNFITRGKLPATLFFYDTVTVLDKTALRGYLNISITKEKLICLEKFFQLPPFLAVLPFPAQKIWFPMPISILLKNGASTAVRPQ